MQKIISIENKMLIAPDVMPLLLPHTQRRLRGAEKAVLWDKSVGTPNRN